MVLDEDHCYQALRSRDARFDGRFFTAVVTTGIYCRPICPARLPLRRNVRFFACSASAEAAGFRPCRRCRPESAPGSPIWNGAANTVSRGLRLIEAGALDRGDGAALAEQLGVGERYLRRLFARHLGTSPQAVATSRRAHFARALLDASDLPMTEIATASGFGSLRQFNHVMHAVFDRTPSELRRRRRTAAAVPVTLRLAFRPPLAWEPLLAFLAARAIPGVEEVEPQPGRYRRAFATTEGTGLLEVSMAPDRRTLELAVRGAGRSGLPHGLLDVVRRVRRLFDLDADPLAIGERLGRSRVLAPAFAAHPGLRVPGAWDPFEILVRAILGQQISVAAATTLAGRLIERCGSAGVVDGAARLRRAFPTAAEIAAADLESIGLPGARARALRGVAETVAADSSLLAASAGLDELVERISRLPGVGPWTAHYLAMRGFAEPDAFPAGDLGLRRAVGGLTPRELAAIAEDWRPWRAYAAMALWTHAPSEEDRHDHRALQRRLAARTHRPRDRRREPVRSRVHRR